MEVEDIKRKPRVRESERIPTRFLPQKYLSGYLFEVDNIGEAFLVIYLTKSCFSFLFNLLKKKSVKRGDVAWSSERRYRRGLISGFGDVL